MARPDPRPDPLPHLEVQRAISPQAPPAPPVRRPPQRSRLRLLAGILAIAGLSAGALLLPGRDQLNAAAIVQANRSFQLSAMSNGRYRASTFDGSAPGGPVVVHEQLFRLDDSDLVQLDLSTDLATGSKVDAHTPLAWIRSPQRQQRLAQLQAEQEALAAEKELLAAGGRPSEVRSALRRIEVAEARRTELLAQLDRTRALAAQGAISAAELQEAELREQVRQRQIALEQSQLEVTRSSARPEALSQIDARIRAAQARVDQLQGLLDADTIRAPFDGTLELGSQPLGQSSAGTTLLQVQDLDTVWVRLPVPQHDHGRVRTGAPVRFVPASMGDRVFQGTIHTVSNQASLFAGGVSFWASAQLDNSDGVLHPGMTGAVTVDLQGEDTRGLASLRNAVFGP